MSSTEFNRNELVPMTLSSMNTSVLNPEALILPYDDYLLPGNKLKLLPVAAWDRLTPDQLRGFCLVTSRYGLPNEETVAFLRDEIGSLKTIEIGAGSGDFGYHMSLKMTDNKHQNWPGVKARYDQMQQPIIAYGTDVEEIDACDAVRKYKPECVFASWVTQKATGFGTGNIHGVKEEYILDRVKKYIVIGNDTTHDAKTILSRPHKKLFLPFLRSRSSFPAKNCIYIWERT